LKHQVKLSGSIPRNLKVEKTKFTDEEAVDVWLRYFSGQHQHHIAADYRINAGRVSEILTGKKHPGSRRIAEGRFNRSA
jgi:hypothetical protein